MVLEGKHNKDCKVRSVS